MNAANNIHSGFIKQVVFLLILLLVSFAGHAQQTDKAIRQGNKLYGKADFESAEAKYREVLEADPTSQKGLFNQGGAYYQQEKYEEALQNYEISAEMMDDPVQRAGAYHNLGNTFFRSQELEKSIEAYKNALRLNPMDEETRYNLALAQSMLKQQEQNQDQNQDQEDQDGENEQDQENQQQQDQDQNQQDQQDQDEQNEEGDEQQDQQQQQQDGENEEEGDQQEQQSEAGEEGEEQKEQMAPEPSKLSKEEVQRILEALANDENKVQGKIIKAKTKTDNGKIEKDW